MTDDIKPLRDQRAKLRVKVKSLAAEARIIRGEERRARRGDLRESLYLHRIHEVRSHARSAHLALGFIKGRTYEQMEKQAFSKPDWPEVRRLLAKYGPGPDYTLSVTTTGALYLQTVAEAPALKAA